jgi:RNA recognition motif-containing protein
MHDFVTRRPRGFGFVAYSKRSSVDKLLEQQYYELNGRRIEVKLAVPRERLALQEAETKPPKPRAGAKAGGFKARPVEYNDGYGGMAGMADGYYYQEPGHNVVMPMYSFSPEPMLSPMGPSAFTTGIPVQLGMLPPQMAMAPAMAAGKSFIAMGYPSPYYQYMGGMLNGVAPAQA